MSLSTSAHPSLHPLRAHPIDPNELVHRRSSSQTSEKQHSDRKLSLKTGEKSKNIIDRINVPLSEFARDCVKLEEKVMQGILAGSKRIKTPKIQMRLRNPTSKGTVSIIQVSVEPAEKKDQCIIVHKEIRPPKKSSRYTKQNRVGHNYRHPTLNPDLKEHRVGSNHRHPKVPSIRFRGHENMSQESPADRQKIDSSLEREYIKVVDFAYQLKFKKAGPVKVTEVRQP